MKIGILGAGQLSQMLALAAHPMGAKPHVLALNSDEPAWGAGISQLGHPENSEDLKSFCKNLALVTFESEFFNAEILENGFRTFKGRVFPSLSCLQILQDRLSQKKFLRQNKIPTAEFFAVSDESDLKKAFEKFNSHFVLKLRTNGYDGKGTFYAKGARDFEKLSNLLHQYPQGFLAESFVSFRRELALMVFRSADSSFAHFPLVESFQKASRCDLVLGPVQHPSLQPLLKKIKVSLEKINYIGAIAFELFDNGSKLSVNEVAPRVHNSGHFSQDAFNFDQFTLHLLCGMGEKLPELQAKAKHFGMINLIGESHHPVTWEIPKNCSLHWYNKIENRPGRKMGHLNCVGISRDRVKNSLLKDRKRFQL